jgi:transcriptional regulator with XRE-family HTH domain
MRPFARIAERIKHFRSLRRKTQVSLAKDASIDYRHFQKLEAGQSDFKVSTIIKLSDALAIPPCYLLQTDPFDEVPKKESVCANEMLSQLSLGVVAWNASGQIIFCNKIFAGIMGMNEDVEGLKAFDMRALIPSKDMSSQQSDYHRSVREGRIKSDFVRVQIQLPKTNTLKVVCAKWNEVQAGKKGEQKGFVAAVWDECEVRDLSHLPTRAI